MMGSPNMVCPFLFKMQIYIFFILLLTTVTFSRQSETFRIWGETENGVLSTPTFMGVHQDATTNLDKDLETEIFPAVPPGDFGVICWLDFFDENQQAQVYSYRDFIPYLDDQFYYEHNFSVILDYPRKHTIHWDDLRGIADSAFLSFGDDFIKVDMLKQNSYFVDNENVSNWKYVVKVWYHPVLTNTSKEVGQVDQIKLIPNPASDYIRLEKISEVTKVEIFDINGQLLRKVAENFDNIDISNLVSGNYRAIIRKKDGKIITRSFFVIN